MLKKRVCEKYVRWSESQEKYIMNPWAIMCVCQKNCTAVSGMNENIGLANISSTNGNNHMFK